MVRNTVVRDGAKNALAGLVALGIARARVSVEAARGASASFGT